MTRPLRAALMAVAALALAAPAQAASPSATVKPPAAGDVTHAHLVFATKGGSGTPKVAIANRAKLSKQLAVAGGVKKLKKNSYLASVTLLHSTGGTPGATPSFKLTMPKGMTFTKFTSKQIGKNLLSSSAAPKWCTAIPPSFAYVSKKLLAGSFPPRFSVALELVRAGYKLNCPGGYEERANLAAALRGEPDPGAGGTPDDGDCDLDCDEDEDEDGEGGGGTQVSPTLQGSGTVTAQGGNAFSYSMTFNEPVHAFLMQVGGASIECPNEYDAGKCGAHNSASGGGVSFQCGGATYTFEFSCSSPRERGIPPPPPPATPAGTPIGGSFTIDGGSVQAGSVKVVAYSASGQSQPITLAGP